MFLNTEEGLQGTFFSGDKVVCDTFYLMKWSLEIKDLKAAYIKACRFLKVLFSL